MEVGLAQAGETLQFGTDRTASFHAAQPLALAALLTVLFALVLWEGRPKITESTPRIQTADSVTR